MEFKAALALIDTLTQGKLLLCSAGRTKFGAGKKLIYLEKHLPVSFAFVLEHLQKLPPSRIANAPCQAFYGIPK